MLIKIVLTLTYGRKDHNPIHHNMNCDLALHFGVL